MMEHRYDHAAMLKIIAGEYRSRRLHAPQDDAITRPNSSRVKESVFNLLRGWFDGTTVIDLFAGVVTMGLEAASRGAAYVLMVERDRQVFDLLQSNIKTLQCGDRATAVNADALSLTWLPRAPQPVDLIFVDPPYRMMEDEDLRRRILDMIARCRPLMGDKGFVVLRSPIDSVGADFSMLGFAGPEVHRYSHEMHVMLYAPATQNTD
jgi:16S rRNA (guanine(966)-N(2))-methyltransferase RsmD